MSDGPIHGDEKAGAIAASFIELYGPVAELEVARRVVMFEAEGNAGAVAAWQAVGAAVARIREELPGR